MEKTTNTLLKLINYADSANDLTNKNTARLFDRLHKSAKKFKFASTDEYKKIISDIKRYGEIYDSATFIEERIIHPDNSQILEIPLLNSDRELSSLNNRIRSRLTGSGLNGKSYIYIAWKMRPEEYFYVGQAKTSSRFNLSVHGNLLESLKQASYFAMLIPHKPTAATLSNLEAALINLIEYKTESLPKYNKRKQRFKIKDQSCSNEQADIALLLEKLSSEFKA